MKRGPLPLIKLSVRFEPDIVTARQKTRHLAELLGFDNQDRARLATAVSELARNVFQYASGGTVEFSFDDKLPQTLYVNVRDNGPGIPHLDKILDGTYESPSGMGVGLSGTKRLMDYFDIEAPPEKGTTVSIGKSLPRHAPLVPRARISHIVDQMVARRPENPFEEMQTQNRDLLNLLDEVQSARARLSELNAELAETNRGVVALYAELDEKASALQRVNEVKTSFLSNMTHEFRTPLSSIISLTRLLLDRMDGELTSEQERQVNYIRTSSEDLLQLVNDLLDLAKVEAGKVTISPSDFDATEVLAGVRGMFRPLLKKGVDLVVEDGEPLALRTDEAKVSQILRNLVSNALKFTESGAVNVTAQGLPGGRARFVVRDSGIGIQPNHLERIFEDYGQVESKLQRQQKGTGLGLPLSRRLARLLGGNIHAQSVVGVGSTFTVEIPCVFEGEEEGVFIEEPTIPQAEATGQFRVLLIDDHEPSRYVLRNRLEREIDARFFEATDGFSGLKSIRECRPDLVFLDLNMPGDDGFTVLARIRADLGLADTPVVIHTGRSLSTDETERLNRDATAILNKNEINESTALTELRTALTRAGFDYREKV